MSEVIEVTELDSLNRGARIVPEKGGLTDAATIAEKKPSIEAL
jgi:hypothetical protein